MFDQKIFFDFVSDPQISWIQQMSIQCLCFSNVIVFVSQIKENPTFFLQTYSAPRPTSMPRWLVPVQKSKVKCVVHQSDHFNNVLLSLPNTLNNSRLFTTFSPFLAAHGISLGTGDLRGRLRWRSDPLTYYFDYSERSRWQGHRSEGQNPRLTRRVGSIEMFWWRVVLRARGVEQNRTAV